MGLFDIFRRPAPIRDAAELENFIDRNAAFVVQKGLYEYSRARAGHYAKVLFGEPEFHRAIEEARWKAFPLGLVMVAEVVDHVLHADDDRDRAPALDQLSAMALSIFDRYPRPDVFDVETWRLLRAELDRRLQLIGTHPPKRAMDIPLQYTKLYFDLMPIHEKLRGRDFPTTANYLKVTLCNVDDELSKRIDRAAFVIEHASPI